MSIECQMYLNKNQTLKRFLHENPRYYKILNRDPSFIYELDKIMREKYKNKLDMFSTFIYIFN